MLRLMPAIAGLMVAGCQSLAGQPELQTLPAIAPIADPALGARVDAELARVASVGNSYLRVAKAFGEEDRASAGFLLGAGVYGAATTAFRPAVKNLQAALLAAGAAQAWRSGLKPAERAKVYVQGYRAMDCVHAAGSVLQEDADLDALVGYRTEVRDLLDEAQDVYEIALVQEAAKPDSGRQALMARLQAQLVKLIALDKAVGVELAAVADAPYRIARVRRQVEDTVDKRLAQSAPDYAGALKLIGETARPSASGAAAADAKAGQPVAAAGGRRKSLAQMVIALDVRLPGLESRTPTRAADAYQRMGDCLAAMA